MILSDCLHQLCACGVFLLNRDGRLVIQSATHQLSEPHAATLKAHKPLLLAILPNGLEQSPLDVLSAEEAYSERLAIMAESGIDETIATQTATTQAQHLLLPDGR